jgi:hypothetical protein
MLRVPPCARSLASRVACNDVDVIELVWRGVEFTSATEVGMKPVPVMLNVTGLLPARRLPGATEVTPGTRLFTTRLADADVPPPGGRFVTVILNVPACAKSPGGRVVVSAAEPWYVVATGLPFTEMTELVTKPPPVTINWDAPLPTVKLCGEREIPPGCGFMTGTLIACDTPPPGGGVTTAMLSVVPCAISPGSNVT